MNSPVFVVGSVLLIGAARGVLASPARLEARIIDDATGAPAAARVALQSKDGSPIAIDGAHRHVGCLGRTWTYVDGAFTATIPDAGAELEIRRGLETRPLSIQLPVNRAGAPIVKTCRLRRWADLAARGYVSGDIHAHQPAPADAVLQLRAEDLGAATLLAELDPQYPYPANECFTGKLDSHSTPGCQIQVGQEIADWQMGHIALQATQRLVLEYPQPGGTLEYWRSFPNSDLGRAARAAHAQNGLVTWSHLCSLPGSELPVAVALGWVDAIELITYYDPTQLPNHWGPWLNSGMSQAEFPVMRAMDIYYQILNAGFQLPVAAGTDKFADDIPLGSNRTYAKTGAASGYVAWLAAIRAGKSFVTNGPLLEFAVDGHEPGEVVSIGGKRSVKARVTARSIHPFTTLEIVVNGRSIAHVTKPLPTNPPVDGVYSMELATTFALTRSAWVAARVAEHPDLLNRILPRGVSVFAHTSPVYFLQDGRKVREPASIAYLKKYVEATIHWLDTKPVFATPEQYQDARRAAADALTVYDKL